MLKNRLIAVILVRDGRVVQSVKFKHTNVIHYDPIHAIESFNKWAVDEIVVLNVSKDSLYREEFINIINKISSECFVPLAVGGWITDLEYGRRILANGADKLVVNTYAFLHREFVSELAQKFGNQCVVVSIDAKRDGDGKNHVVIDRGSEVTAAEPGQWAKDAEELGAGEIFINSIDNDGNRKGYDLELIRSVVERVSIPVIAMGGVLTWEHLLKGITEGQADAVAAANIFHYTEHSTKKAKKYLLEAGLNLRKI